MICHDLVQQHRRTYRQNVIMDARGFRRCPRSGLKIAINAGRENWGLWLMYMEAVDDIGFCLKKKLFSVQK